MSDIFNPNRHLPHPPTSERCSDFQKSSVIVDHPLYNYIFCIIIIIIIIIISIIIIIFIIINICLQGLPDSKANINTIEPEAEFLSEIRPSVVPEAKPRALREV